MLRGWDLSPEVRTRDENGQVVITSRKTSESANAGSSGRLGRRHNRNGGANGKRSNGAPADAAKETSDRLETRQTISKRSPVRVYPYGVGQNRLRSAAKSLKVPMQLVDSLSSADVVMTLKNYYRQQPQPIVDAERRNIPIYIIRSNTVTQMEQCLADIFHLSTEPVDLFAEAMSETQDAIQRVLNGASVAELRSQTASIRSQQHQLARAANLVSHSYGREPKRRVRIFQK